MMAPVVPGRNSALALSWETNTGFVVGLPTQDARSVGCFDNWNNN